MPTGPTLYFDRSLGCCLPDALRVVRVPNVIHHHSPPEAAGVRRKRGQTSLFDDTTPDDEWLEFTARRGWIAFSQDYKMHLEPAPLAAIKQHNARVFYLWGAEASRWDKLRAFASAFDRILAEAANANGPFVRRVTRTGSLEVVTI